MAYEKDTTGRYYCRFCMMSVPEGHICPQTRPISFIEGNVVDMRPMYSAELAAIIDALERIEKLLYDIRDKEIR